MKYWLFLLGLGFAAAQMGNPDIPNVQYRPVMELAGTVNWLLEMGQQPDLDFSKDQASKLLPLLRPLAGKKELKAAEATATRNSIEELLSPQQHKWLEEQRKSLQLLAQKRAIQGRGSSNLKPSYVDFLPSSPALTLAMQQGKPFNPFTQVPYAEKLSKLVGMLGKS